MAIVDVSIQNDMLGCRVNVTGSIHQAEMMREVMSGAIFAKVCELIAERYVVENYAEIAKHIDPQAVANLSVAEAGAEISKTLKKEFAKEYVHIHHKEKSRMFDSRDLEALLGMK